MSIVLATCAALPDLDADDQRLYEALKSMDVPVEIAIWDDPSVDWGQYALCVIRSTWDYVPKRDAYLRWADSVASQTELWNPASLIRWNTDKTYLRDMESQGIRIVETAWLRSGASVDFEALRQTRGWAEMVIKPVISSSGKDTYRLNPDGIATQSEALAELLAQRDLMAQPLMTSVFTSGELSFLFIDGQFSHAVTKIPASGEFRVQEHLGGILKAFEPTAEQLAFAENVMRKIPAPTLYARVDLMLDEQGQLCLSELELTEPSMYLAFQAGSERRFARVIQDKLNTIR